jgi:hypothetical protein
MYHDERCGEMWLHDMADYDLGDTAAVQQLQRLIMGYLVRASGLLESCCSPGREQEEFGQKMAEIIP